MKYIIPSALCAMVLLPALARAQDEHARPPVAFELDEEKLEIQADIPSVDLILSFREIQERTRTMKASFLDEIIESAKNEPF